MSPMNEPQDNPAERTEEGEPDRGRPQGSGRGPDSSSGSSSRPERDSNRGGQSRRADDRSKFDADRGSRDNGASKEADRPQERRDTYGNRKAYGTDRPGYGSGKSSYGERQSGSQRSGDSARGDENRSRPERGGGSAQGPQSSSRRPGESGATSRTPGVSDPRAASRTQGSYGDRNSRPSYGDRNRTNSGGEGNSNSSDSRNSNAHPNRPERGRDDRRSSTPRSDSGSRPSGDAANRPSSQGRSDRDERATGPRAPRAVDRSQSGDRNGPPIPEEVQFSDLGKEARAPLRTLSKDNAEAVGRHLAMVVQLIDENPELAYEHAQAAVRNAGRVDVVREAAGISAYRTGRYAEALRELRTVRRLNGSSEHLPIMADCERGLKRPERALALAASPEAQTLDAEGKIELAIVISGARMDLGEPEAAEATLDELDLTGVDKMQRLRVVQAKAGILEGTGRAEQASALLKGIDKKELRAAAGGMESGEDIVAYDLDEAEVGDAQTAEAVADSSSAAGVDNGPAHKPEASATRPTREDPA